MANISMIIFSILFGGIFAFKPIYSIAKSNFNSKEIALHKKELILSLIIIIGCLVRTVCLGSLPGGLNQDEASIGYEAFSLANYGIDRNGLPLPVHFIAWGSGQNALYAYLAIPFVKILGLSAFSVRLTMAIIGCISIYVFYYLAKNIIPKHAIFATFMFAINPWHIEKSRWALESNLFPDIFLLGVLLLVLAINGKKCMYILSGIVFGLSTYAYGTSYFILPIFCVVTLVSLLAKKQITIKNSIIFMGSLVIIALPMVIFVLLNYTEHGNINLFGFTIPKLYQNRQTFILNIGDEFTKTLIENIKTAINIIFKQHDGMVWSGMEFFGTTYVFTIPFFILGIIKSFKTKQTLETAMQAWLFVSIFMLIFINANINRANILFIPQLYFTIKGLASLTEVKHGGKGIKVCISSCMCVLFIAFSFSYFGTVHQEKLAYQFFNGANEAIVTADGNFDKVYLTQDINEPYIYYLFNTKTSTEEYLKTRVIENPKDAFENITAVNNFEFKDINPEDLRKYECYIAPEYLISSLDSETYVIEHFKNYVIISKK